LKKKELLEKIEWMNKISSQLGPLDINMKNLPKNPTGVHNKEARNAILSLNNWLEEK
jgi:hypothetical protein